MGSRRPSHATVVAYVALFAAIGGGAVAIGQAGGGDETIRACVLKRGHDRGQVRVLAKGKCKRKERALAWNQRGPAGAAGERGPQGPQGLVGPAGTPAGSMLFGWVRPADLPGSGSTSILSPLGDAQQSVGPIIATPNAPMVFRDLFVRVITSPGAVGAKWVVTLQGDGAGDVISCQIVGSFATSCNSAQQEFTVAPGGSLRLLVDNVNGAAATNMYYAYRAETP